MKFKFKYTLLLLINLIFLSCRAQNKSIEECGHQRVRQDVPISEASHIQVGADSLKDLLLEIKGKKIAVVTNQTGVLSYGERVHIVDFLLSKKMDLVRIFSPEHGFRGEADAGEKVRNGRDVKTGLPIISLYGKNKKPKPSQLKGVDLVIFDLQDVGVRFYTYISTLHYVMEAVAENDIPIWVLDRPNPNGAYIDGPVLKKGYESFVGMHKVPIVYGMTIGEYAKMINGERWLKKGIQADLRVVPNQNYDREMSYDLPIKPSPNLPNAKAINLYPSLCFFEGTSVSVGRGTDWQFQVYGSPYLRDMEFRFLPKPNKGAKKPLFNGEYCFGEDLRNEEMLSRLELRWLIKAYKANGRRRFFIPAKKGKMFFDKLAGTDMLRRQIEKGVPEQEIRKSWQRDIAEFKKVREKYLIYR